MKHAGKLVTHRQFLGDLGAPHASQTHCLRVYMVRLRQLEKDAARPRYLVTEAGVGCRLKTDD
jgi:two-component system, OmpR family, KDP operon response regulator KdpE